MLLVPRVMDGLTQLVDQASMRLALQFCEHSNNPYFRLCYNSLGAYGTINHLHFQVGHYCHQVATAKASQQGVMLFMQDSHHLHGDHDSKLHACKSCRL